MTPGLLPDLQVSAEMSADAFSFHPEVTPTRVLDTCYSLSLFFFTVLTFHFVICKLDVTTSYTGKLLKAHIYKTIRIDWAKGKAHSEAHFT